MLASNLTLSQKALERLMVLTQANIDSRDGLRDAADHLTSQSLDHIRSVFTTLAAERADQARELQELVSANAQTPLSIDSLATGFHRTRLNLRQAFGGGESALLNEIELGDLALKSSYDEALEELNECACAPILHAHRDKIAESCDLIRHLRD